MKHFLVTRFNLALDSWKTAKDGQQVLTDSWLEHRLRLFETYCLPSVMNQSNQQFIWCVFFDINTPQRFRPQIAGYARRYANFIPVFIDGFRELNAGFEKFITERITDHDTHIITTRMDNDDLIHRDFIATIQQLAEPVDERQVIDLRRGHQLSIETGRMELRTGKNPFGPFISVVEPSTEFTTVLSRMHREWREEKRVTIFDRTPLWVELVHERNKLNGVRRTFPMISEVDRRDFGVPFPMRSEISTSAIITNNLLILPYALFALVSAPLRRLLGG